MPGLPSARSWGDGATDRRPHVIVDISYAEGRVECRDGTVITVEEGHSLERAWDAHRGVTTVHQRVVDSTLASDSEVSEFLARIADPNHVVNMGGAHSVTPSGQDDLEDAFYLLERLAAMQARCTCATTDIRACPNYEVGDEEMLAA